MSTSVSQPVLGPVDVALPVIDFSDDLIDWAFRFIRETGVSADVAAA